MKQSKCHVHLFGQVAMAMVMPTNLFIGDVRVNHAGFVTTEQVVDIIKKI